MFKPVRIFVLMLFLLAGCKPSMNERARDLILRYGDANFKHYQPIEFEPVQPYFVPYKRSQKAISYNLQIKNLRRKKDSLARLAGLQNNPAYLLKTDSVLQALNTAELAAAQHKQSYQAQRKGWQVVHSYNQRANGSPMTRLTTVFIIDADCKNILETYNN